MKTNNNLFYLLTLAVLSFLYSCDDAGTDPVVEEQAKYSNGVLVVNQGNFSNADGSLDFFHFEDETLTPFVYQKENEEEINSIIEDVAFHNDKMYIVANAADKIVVTDADSLNKIASITDAALATPRYFTATGDKGYVSVWGPYEDDYSLKNSKVAVLDLNSNAILSTIPVPAGPEGIVALNNKVFVANSWTDTITVIDTQTDAVIDKIKTTVPPQHFVVDSNNKLWVIFGNSISQIDPSSYEELMTIDFEGKSLSGKAQLVGNSLYFHTSQWNSDYTKTSNGVYKIDITASSPTAEVVVEKENMRTFGIHPETGNVYGGVAVGAEAGTIVVFDKDGKELDNFASGKFPYEIIFR
jgi:YVTN family beta-propeller protein